MRRVLRGARSALAAVAALLCIALTGSVFLYPLVVPASLLVPGKRRALVSWYMKLVCTGIFACLRAGGARFRRIGTVPTRDPVLVVMNHQSLLDIVTATLTASPYVPAFVTRRRYARFYIPFVSTCVWLLGGPVVDPKRDPKGALETIRRAGALEPHALLIFPEGHRTLDGEIRRFKAAGFQAILEARRLPVYLVVSDGVWESRRLVDFVASVPEIRGETEVLGPFAPPAAEGEIPAFIGRMRDTMVGHLREMRRRHERVP